MISGEMAYSGALNAEARFIGQGKIKFWPILRIFSGPSELGQEYDLQGEL